jgi:small subunit ribosomal protein S4e
VPKSWPVSRKTDTFTVKADAGPHGEAGVPLVILLRDVLGYVDSLKEARYALNEGTVRVNGEDINDPKRPIGMFDIVAFTARGEYYRVFPDEGGRLALSPIDEEAADSKLGKVVGKRKITGGQTQLNLHDGRNLLVDDGSITVDDSVVIDNEDGSVVAHFPYEEGALVTAVRGSHAGEIGEVVTIDVTPGSGPNNVVFEAGADRFETIEEYVFVIDEQFVDNDELDDEDENEPDDEPEETEADDE